jgi:uncharacterized protein (DUF983 family)
VISGRSRGWLALCVAALAGWLGVAGAAVTRADTADDRTAAVDTFIVGGLVAAAALLVVLGLRLRRNQRRARRDLYHRLAIAMVPPDAMERATRGRYAMRSLYEALTLVGVGLVAAAALVWTDLTYRREILAGMVVVLVGGVIVAGAVVPSARELAAPLVRPLGLVPVDPRAVRTSAVERYRPMQPAAVFEGPRHERRVLLAHGAHEAVTVLDGNVDHDVDVPGGVADMAAITGEPPRVWSGVSVSVDRDAVVVVRTAADAGDWFLHDLLLAETIAGTRE